MSDYITADNYPNFGKRRRIPGLKGEKLLYPKDKLGSNIQLFAGTQYEKDGVNGAYVGLKGQVSLYNGGDVELYGGVGNIVAAGTKFSHTFWENNNLAFKGYVRADGAISLTDKREFEIEHHADTQNSDKQRNVVTAEGPIHIIQGDSVVDGNMVYETEFQNENILNMHNDAIINGNIFASNIKTAIGGEITYTNNQGNLDINIGGEIGLNSELATKADYIEDYNRSYTISLNSADFSDATFEPEHHYCDMLGTEHTCTHLNFHPNESVNFSNNIDIGGFETKLGIDSRLYGAVNCGFKYRMDRFQVGMEAGVQYSEKQLSPIFKAGISYFPSKSPLIHRYSARVIGNKSHMRKDLGFKYDSDYSESRLNLFVKGQAIDGVNGIAAGLEGKVPLNNVGTALNISAGVGNIITADVNLSQKNPIVNDKWSLTGRIGAKLDYSLTQKDTYVTKKILINKEFKDSTNSTNISWHDFFNFEYFSAYQEWFEDFVANGGTGESFDYPVEPAPETGILTAPPSPHNINEIYEISCTCKNQLNRSSIKAYADLNVEYQHDNWSVYAGIGGGIMNTPDNGLNFSDNGSDLVISSSEYKQSRPVNENTNVEHEQFTAVQGQWTEIYTTENAYDWQLTSPTELKIWQKYCGSTYTNLNSKQNGTLSYIPKFKPYVNMNLGVKYDFDNKNAIKGEVNYDGQFGGLVTYTHKLR